jgi:hypothetical protein
VRDLDHHLALVVQVCMHEVVTKHHREERLEAAASELAISAYSRWPEPSASSASTAKEYMFTGHAEHGAEATCALYEPGAHDRQSALPLPPKPALHGQLVVLSNAICAPAAIDSKSNKMSAFDASVWIM